MKKKIFVICLILIAIFFSSNLVFAQNFTDLSNDINDNDFVALNDDVILNQNTTGEDVRFEKGIVIENREVYIEGNNHIISGKDSDGNQVRIFNIIDSKVTLANMVLTSASFNGCGGAINLPYGSDLILKNVTFRNNSALGIYGEGGALYARGHIFIYNSTFENNYASGAAGAVYARSTSHVEGSNFTNNTAKWYGGGIYGTYLMNINSCSFEKNTAYSGAAFHHTLDHDDDNARMKFNTCSFSNNVANDGAVVSTSTYRSISFESCNFTSNRANRGGVLYKNSLATTNFDNCLFENNSANTGALFYEDSFEGDQDTPVGYLNVRNCILKSNVASIMASIFYAKAGNIRIDKSLIDNNTNRAIYNGKGYIIVTNSDISNYGSNFITQFLSGTVIVENNNWGHNLVDYKELFDCSDDSVIRINGKSGKSSLGLIDDSHENLDVKNYDDDLGECCSVYVRLNNTNYVLSQRRDGGTYNHELYVVMNENYVKEFRPRAEYYFLSKAYTNGWVIGTGGWDDAGSNEKVEAIASDMALNGKITMEALKLILSIKKINEVGHLLIVAPDGTWGNIITYQGRDYINMGVLGDGGYIISPNDPSYRKEGYLSSISDVVRTNINLSARDTYGFERHCIVAHNVSFNNDGFSDGVFVSNEDGRFINQDNTKYCDEFWFGEEYFYKGEIPIAFDSIHLGTYGDKIRSVVSRNAVVGYKGDYVYKAQLFNADGSFLENEKVNVTVNGRTDEYSTNNRGIIEVSFLKVTAGKNIVVINPSTGEMAKSVIKVVPRLVGSNVVMDYFDGSKYKVRLYGADGMLVGAGESVKVTLNNKTYTLKTNSKGMATLTIPKTVTPKTYTLTATYAGQTIKNTVKVKQILKTANQVTKKSDKKLVLKATLKTSNNKAIEGKSISFTFNGKTYKAKTNSKGIATYTLNKNIVSKLKVSKSYVLKAVYLNVSVQATVKVNR